jgi:hypothetical protein
MHENAQGNLFRLFGGLVSRIVGGLTGRFAAVIGCFFAAIGTAARNEQQSSKQKHTEH